MKLIQNLKKRLFGFPHTAYAEEVSKSEIQDALRQSRAGDKLQIVGADGEVYIYSVELNLLLGKVERPIAKRLLKLFQGEFCLDGKIVCKTGGLPYKYYGLIVEIYDSATYLVDADITALRE